MSHRLLLVTDQTDQAELLRDHLVASGYEVILIEDGDSAIRDLGENLPDAVIVERTVTGMEASGLCRCIKSDDRLAGMPVLVLTSLHDPVALMRTLGCGADNILARPFEPAQLLQRLEVLLASPSPDTIAADRQHIVDTLTSSFEKMVQVNDRIRRREQEPQPTQDELAEVAVAEQQRAQLTHEEIQERPTIRSTGVATWNLFLPEGRFEWSSNARTVFGLSSETRIDHLHEWLQLLRPDDRRFLVGLTERAAGSSDTELADEWEYRLTGEDGVERSFWGRGELMADPAGGLVVRGAAIDVTHRRQLEDELRARERMLSAVLSASPDGIIVVGPDDGINFASQSVRNIIGREAEYLLGRSPRAILADEDAPSIYLGSVRLRSGGGTEQLRVAARHADGHVVPLDARIGGLTDDHGETDGYVVVLRDVTEQARLEEQLARAKDEADQASAAKSDYLSRMSHELRTPMNTVLGFSQLLQLSDLAPADRQSVDRILCAGRHLLELIDDVLDIARIEAGSIQLSLEPVAVHAVVAEAVQLVQRQAEERDVTLPVPTDRGEWPHVRADRQRLLQIVVNLLSNAVKYNRRGGRIDLACTEEADGARHRIVVVDTGYGIPAADLDRVFTPFDRLDADRGQVAGTGLGLALSQHLADAMGGSIGCDSTEGQGSTFWIELPAAPVASEETSADVPSHPSAGPRPLAGRLLYIEDNPMNLELMRQVFASSQALEILHASSGDDGVAMAIAERPDLVLLDLNLHGASGREVLRQLRADDSMRELPIVIVSADATITSAAELTAAGADGYLTKPFTLPELRELVARMLTDGRDGAEEGAGVTAPPPEARR